MSTRTRSLSPGEPQARARIPTRTGVVLPLQVTRGGYTCVDISPGLLAQWPVSLAKPLQFTPLQLFTPITAKQKMWMFRVWLTPPNALSGRGIEGGGGS